MFKNRMTVTIKEAKETRRKRKKGEDEKGDLLMLLALECLYLVQPCIVPILHV